MRDIQLQAANRYMLERYSIWTTHVVTLTLLDRKAGTKVIDRGWAKGAINNYETELTEAKARSSIRYFIEALNYKLYKKKTRKNKTKQCCRIVALPILEGATGNKRMHFHVLLGNLPAESLENLEQTIQEVWAGTKWGMARMDLKEIYDADGIAHYLAKEVGFRNNEAVCWQEASIPGRLRGVWA